MRLNLKRKEDCKDK